VHSFSDPYTSEIIKGIENYISESGYGLLLCDSKGDASVEKGKLTMLSQNMSDGIIIIPTLNSTENLKYLQRKNKPFVIIENNLENIQADKVLIDNFDAGYKAVEYLIKK
jgi:LacI family transcriptional regulator